MRDIGALINQSSAVGADYINRAVQTRARIDALRQRQAELQAQRGQQLREKYTASVDELVAQLPGIAKNNPDKIPAALKAIESVLTSQITGPGGNPITLAQLAGVDVNNVLSRAQLAVDSAANPTQAGLNAGQTLAAQAPYEAAAIMTKLPATAATTAATTAAAEETKNRLNPSAIAYYNPKTQQLRSVNESNPADVNAARNAGFFRAPTTVQATSVGGLDLQKGTLKNIETTIVNNSARLQRLDLIEQSFDPSFATFESQFRAKGLAFKEKLGGDLTAGQRDFLENFTTARRAAANELNSTLKEASGAAVTETEAKRFSLETPDFENDSPTQFMAKLRRGKEALRLAQIRLQIIRGRSGDISGANLMNEINKIPLSGVKTILKQQAGRFEDEIRRENPNIGEGELKSEVKARLAERFGLLR